MQRVLKAVTAFAASGIVVIGAPIGPQTPAVLAASSTDIVGTTNGEHGEQVVVLPNGNFVVTDPKFDRPGGADVGAIHLYDGRTAALISTVTGSRSGDEVGSGKVVVVGGSNVVVVSERWANGNLARSGAATWISGTTGLSGQVSATNSMIGSTGDDFLTTSVVALTNGNYVVANPYWNAGAVLDVGAATWGNGATGTGGVISAANSFVGAYAFDYVAASIVPLTNGHYVVESHRKARNAGTTLDAGAVTWGNGAGGSVGAVNDSNSLYGTAAGDWVGYRVFALPNGNYVVGSSEWSGMKGAATWADGTKPTAGPVTASNSMVGTTGGDRVGGTVTVLTNGNYVVSSPAFTVSGVAGVGAVRWANGAGGTVGTISNLNSIVGSRADDFVGLTVVALTNGNYVVASPSWTSNSAADVGAVTWASGAGVSGFNVSVASSLVGTAESDALGQQVTPLPNGNYVVASFYWNNGAAADAGAVTWGSGTTGVKGAVSPANSLVGTSTDDEVGYPGVTALTNGNYVVQSQFWRNGSATEAGASTWGDGTTGTSGVVGVGNSLVGTRSSDGLAGRVTALTNGNFVVSNPLWHDADGVDVGATTWARGTGPTSGAITAANSIVGLRTGDASTSAIVALSNGDYAVRMPRWDNGPNANAGAVVWASGTATTSAIVSAANSLVGSRPDDQVGGGRFDVLADGYSLVSSYAWDSDAGENVGAITLGYPSGTRGAVSAGNSVVGTTPFAGNQMVTTTTFLPSGALAIGRPADNRVTLLAPFDFVPLTPARLADTRLGASTVDDIAAGIGRRDTGTTMELRVGGRGGVPATAVAAALNVTVTEPAVDLFVTVFPCGEPRPTASSLNAAAGATVANAVIARIGAGGSVCLFTSQVTHLVVDVTGYFPLPSAYRSLNPARVIDTRPGEVTADGLQAGGGRTDAGSTTTVQVAGRVGVPADTATVALNVTATGAGTAGFVTVFPCGEARPLASNLNVVAGVTVANLVLSRVGTGGNVCVYTQSPMHLVVDVSGYFPPNTSYESVLPTRLLDTRTGAGLQPAGATIAVQAPGGVSAVLNVTVTEPAVGGFVTVYPCGIDRPLASNLNYSAGQTVANAVVVRVGVGGEVCLYTSQAAHLVVDVNGYFTH